MDKSRKASIIAGICSVVYLFTAICLLLGVCGHCYPALGQWVDAVIAGSEDSPVREAFNTLAEGLETGSTLKEAAQTSFDVLFGDAD